jgi:hypothetical protein
VCKTRQLRRLSGKHEVFAVFEDAAHLRAGAVAVSRWPEPELARVELAPPTDGVWCVRKKRPACARCLSPRAQATNSRCSFVRRAGRRGDRSPSA